MSTKATLFVTFVVLGLLLAGVGVLSLVIGSWMPLLVIGCTLGGAGAISALLCGLMLWADRRWPL